MSTQEAAVQWDKHNFFEISFSFWILAWKNYSCAKVDAIKSSLKPHCQGLILVLLSFMN